MSSESQGIFVTDRPTWPPAKCARCGGQTYDGRKYVDFGVDQELPPVAVPGVVSENVERGGVVYLCSFCIREIFKATFPNIGPPVAQIESDLADAKQIILLQKDLLEHLRSEVDRLKQQVPPVAYTHEKEPEERIDATSNRYIKFSSDATDGSAPVSDDEAESDVPESTKSESGTSEQDSKPRHSHIPSLAELLEADNRNKTGT